MGMVQRDEIFAFDEDSREASSQDQEKKESVDNTAKKTEAPPMGSKDNSKPDTPEVSKPSGSNTGGNNKGSTLSFTIASGSTLGEVAEQLEEMGVIKDKAQFLDLVKEKNMSNKLIAGTYELSRNENMERLVRILCGIEGSGN